MSISVVLEPEKLCSRSERALCDKRGKGINEKQGTWRNFARLLKTVRGPKTTNFDVASLSDFDTSKNTQDFISSNSCKGRQAWKHQELPCHPQNNKIFWKATCMKSSLFVCSLGLSVLKPATFRDSRRPKHAKDLWQFQTWHSLGQCLAKTGFWLWAMLGQGQLLRCNTNYAQNLGGDDKMTNGCFFCRSH